MVDNLTMGREAELAKCTSPGRREVQGSQLACVRGFEKMGLHTFKSKDAFLQAKMSVTYMPSRRL